jgi:hypothetical protein
MGMLTALLVHSRLFPVFFLHESTEALKQVLSAIINFSAWRGFPCKSFFLLSTKSKFILNFIKISSKFRWFDFPKFRFRCQNFDFDLSHSRIPTKFHPNLIGISISVFILELKFASPALPASGNVLLDLNNIICFSKQILYSTEHTSRGFRFTRIQTF